MNLFDSNITHWINQYAGQSKSFDYFMNALGNDVFVTGGLLCALVWFLWFKPSIKQNHIRLSLISTLFGSTIATFTSRLSPHLGLPFSSIPMVRKDIGFIVPYFVENRGYETVSSFPSDHATLLFALVFGLFLVSRKIGTWAFLYTLIFMAIPRIYVGVHFATDILAGASIGIFFVSLAHTKWFMRNISDKTLSFSQQSPAVFYSLMFLLSFQFSTLFMESRQLMHTMSSLIKGNLN